MSSQGSASLPIPNKGTVVLDAGSLPVSPSDPRVQGREACELHGIATPVHGGFVFYPWKDFCGWCAAARAQRGLQTIRMLLDQPEGCQDWPALVDAIERQIAVGLGEVKP